MPESKVAAFYEDLRRRLSEMPGVRAATLSHASLIRAGRAAPDYGQRSAGAGHAFPATGPRFFTTMQIPILRGREIDGPRSPGSGARRGSQRSLRQNQLRR